MKKRMQRILMVISISALFSGFPCAFAGQGPGGGAPPGNLIQEFDQDGDGLISQEEFPGPAEHFSRMDANQDGYIDEDESRMGPPQMENMFEKDDQNRDGKVSRDEFGGPPEMFDELDADGNGYIDENEMPQGPPPGKGGSKV